MSDPATSARTARESLSRGLAALQSDPNVPPQLLDLAAPIAQAMGALHQIERSNGMQLTPHATVALQLVRTALEHLQAHPPTHPAVNQALEAVASSLGLVRALSQLAGAPAPQVAPQAQPARAQPPAAIAPQPVFPQASRDPFAPPIQAEARPAAPPVPPSRPQAPPATGDMPIVTADLGAQSSTNFYKGLSGNDIIDHGGLFVSTYMIPKIGTPVRLRVSLPGGYEFEANAVVRWSREQSDAEGGDAPPGFGAQFTQIAAEARQLVYRYVRNREPLFHDDL